MNNMQIDVETEKPLNVGSFGFRIIFNCMVSFREDITPEIVIKKKSGAVVVKNAHFQSAQSGVVEYTFVPGDLSEPGTYEFQVRQVATDNTFAFRTPVFQLPVYRSLDIEL